MGVDGGPAGTDAADIDAATTPDVAAEARGDRPGPDAPIEGPPDAPSTTDALDAAAANDQVGVDAGIDGPPDADAVAVDGAGLDGDGPPQGVPDDAADGGETDADTGVDVPDVPINVGGDAGLEVFGDAASDAPVVEARLSCLAGDHDGGAPVDGGGGAAAPDAGAGDAASDGNTSFHWPNTPPASSPFARSTSIKEIVFTGRHRLYATGDTFIPTWGSDDNLYTPFTYGEVGGVDSGSGLGWAKLTGHDPLALTVANAGTIDAGNPGPYSGAFPAASAILNGVWFYGASSEDGNNGPCGYWCVGGPFIGFWISNDYGNTWAGPKDGQMTSLFGESALDGKKVKMGGPRFVDFGKEMMDSPDGKAYVVASGATDPSSPDNWIAADQVYLARLTLTPTTANDVTAWEFYGGKDAGGKAIWSHAFADIKPLLEWPNHMGSVSMTYLPALKKYLMAVSRPADGFDTYGGFDTYFLEADDVTGPYRMVQYLHDFGMSAYYVNIPSRFLGCDGKTMWIQYSSNDSTDENPPGSRYALSFQEVVLDVP
ncbi:MAG TPA: hypothetical protein VHJ20_17080 [Polyangia bacterium]|nr:hypothetical protein [Polyangia bacterium]